MNIQEIIARIDALDKTRMEMSGSPDIRDDNEKWTEYVQVAYSLNEQLRTHWPAISAELKRLQADNDYMFAALELTEGRLKDREATIKKARNVMSHAPYESAQRLRERIREALAALNELASDVGDRWMPIETAPKDGSEFVAANARQGFVKQLVSWNKIHGIWQSKGGFIHMQHTHWFPLPDAPKGGE